MTETEATPPQTPPIDAVSPDELMSDFRGQSLVKIVVFTIALHVVALAALSPGYLKTQIFGESPEPEPEVAGLSDEELMNEAEQAGTDALRKIADQYGVSVRELKAQLASDAPAADPPPSVEGDADSPVAEEPQSQIERDLQVEADGPAVPDLSIEEEDDIFAPGAP
ncbi:MAG: hypothetical protein ACPGYV_02685 [Phycisphaeraceae bacterium]